MNRNARRLACAAAILVAQIAIVKALPAIHEIWLEMPLSTLPSSLHGWTALRTIQIPQEDLDLLRADDTLSRVYANPNEPEYNRAEIGLLLAYFKSQKGGVSPHSPKVCLPGGGWVVTDESRIRVNLTDGSPIEINRFIISRDVTEPRLLILYWFQSQNRTLASEYAAKLDTVFRSIRYRRSDTAFVRVSTPLPMGEEDKAEKAALMFIQRNFKEIRSMLPG